MLEILKCIFRLKHDFEPIPPPTNKDWSSDLPEKICIDCGYTVYKKTPKQVMSRQDKAKNVFEYRRAIQHRSEYAGRSVISPLCPGPWSEYIDPFNREIDMPDGEAWDQNVPT